MHTHFSVNTLRSLVARSQASQSCSPYLSRVRFLTGLSPRFSSRISSSCEHKLRHVHKLTYTYAHRHTLTSIHLSVHAAHVCERMLVCIFVCICIDVYFICLYICRYTHTTQIQGFHAFCKPLLPRKSLSANNSARCSALSVSNRLGSKGLEHNIACACGLRNQHCVCSPPPSRASSAR
jgi:hypothetical protein